MTAMTTAAAQAMGRMIHSKFLVWVRAGWSGVPEHEPPWIIKGTAPSLWADYLGWEYN